MTPAKTLSNRRELTLPWIQIDDCLKCHHRNFIQQLMETEAETHSGALSWAPKVQLMSGRSENMSKEVKTMMGIPTETANGSSSIPPWLGRNQHWTKLEHLNVGDSCMAGTDSRATETMGRVQKRKEESADEQRIRKKRRRYRKYKIRRKIPPLLSNVIQFMGSRHQ